MLTGTHIAFSSALYLGGAALFEYPVDPIGWVLAAFFSLMPDIDLPTSRVGRPLFWISTRLEKNFGHRTITHSVIGVGILTLLASPLLLSWPGYFWAILGGYWSHLWVDMLNVRGVDLFWPSPVRVVMPGKIRYRMEVGSKAEMVLFSSFVVACVALYPLGQMGMRGGLHRLLQDFEMARDEFLEKAGSQWFTLELKAIDNLTLEHIECECPVLGAWQSGLIVSYQGEPRAVGKSQLHHNLYPTDAVLLEGEPLRVVSHRVDMKGRSLAWLVRNLKANHDYYLMGELWVDAEKIPNVNDLDLYHPVMWSGDKIRLHYARPGDLGDYQRVVAIRGEVIVQFWLRPGDKPVDLNLMAGGAREAMPAALDEMF